ncbi:HXXEE domain-containing protein [Mucilaginibacter polytrichastri]|uniref:HXXEE domain-containing protein n=1 Tax=Mucilaginibacter polytrichastri TaxID=1302689 RepID=A0A1Q6A542_9SPHI|nr:HXXEE domain-containing protein [Mucilaginibacter polytrichastri]OKS89131.1 hypothetical protein RG47T_4612 [Mucilaginibacter polytrichastri]SFS96907.1 Protein of unknown function with HXXEE motif-containing protein [Mucilaginibacter polytrichastri]
MKTYYLVAWLLPFAIIAHIIEEFVFPGGFIKWYRDSRPDIAASITKSRHTVINIVYIVLSFIPLLLGPAIQGISWLLALTSIAAVNALFHILGSARTKTYSPGEVTAMFIYLPLTIYINWELLATHAITLDYAGKCFLVGIAYHIWSAYSHRQRAIKFEQYQTANK